MTVNSIRSVLGENLAATADARRVAAGWGRRKMLCWVCQKDKPQSDGRKHYANGSGRAITQLAAAGSPCVFICFDCRPAKEST